MTLKDALKAAQTKANIYRRDFYVYNRIYQKDIEKATRGSFFEVWPYPLTSNDSLQQDVYTICPE